MSSSRKSFEDELDELFAQPLPGSSRQKSASPRPINAEQQKNTAPDLGDLQRNGSAGALPPRPPQHESTALDESATDSVATNLFNSAAASAPEIRLSAGSLMDHGNDDSFAPTQLQALDPMDSVEPFNVQQSAATNAKQGAAIATGVAGAQGPMVSSQWPSRASDRSSSKSKEPRGSSRTNSDMANNKPSGSGKLIWLALGAVVIVCGSAGAWLALQPSGDTVIQQRVSKPSSSDDIEKAQAVTGPQTAATEGVQAQAAPIDPAAEQSAAATPAIAATPEQASDPSVVLNSTPVAQIVVGSTLSDRPAQPVAAPSHTPARPVTTERRKPTARNLDSLLD